MEDIFSCGGLCGGGLSACRVIGFVLSLPHLYLHYAAPKIAAESGKGCGPEPVGIRPGVGSNVVPDLPKPPRCATQSSGPHVNWIAAGITQVLPSQSAEMMEWGGVGKEGRKKGQTEQRMRVYIQRADGKE